MKRWPINHLTAEDLDAFHSASLPAELREHLAECEECRTMAELDRMVLEELAALPSYSPRDGFVDRVLAGVRHARPAHLRRYLPSAVGTWGRVAAAAGAGGRPGASLVRLG